MLEHIIQSTKLFAPEIALVVTFCTAIILDLFLKRKSELTAYIAMFGLIVCAGLLFHQSQNFASSIFSNMFAVDPFSHFFKWVILVSTILIIVFSLHSKEIKVGALNLGEYYSLLMALTLGMFLMTGASNVLMMYLSIELASLSSYILAGYTKQAKDSSEASLKFVIYGALSSGLMLYGISILYGLTGALDFYEINSALRSSDANSITLIISGILILAGFGYKISAVPFHFWTPDVYEGAPITITAFLSVASKAAGFALMIRFLKVSFSDSLVGTWTTLQGFEWNHVLAVLSVLTMTLGNLVAIWQNNLKRLLAYSSIAHAGYMLLGVVVLTDVGLSAVLVYFVVYLFMNLGAFYLVMVIADHIGSEDIDKYKGLGYRIPFLGVAMAVFLLSLVGIPPTAGFIGKLYIFSALIDAKLFWLAIIGVLNSVVSLYYYMRILRNMFLRDPEGENSSIPLSKKYIVVVILLLIPTILFGVYFSFLLEFAQASVLMFGK